MRACRYEQDDNASIRAICFAGPLLDFCSRRGKMGKEFWKNAIQKTSKSISSAMLFLAERRWPKAAMRSPIPIEPKHSFSYGHVFVSGIWLAGANMTHDAQHDAHTGQLMHCIHLLEIYFMVNRQLSNQGIR